MLAFIRSDPRLEEVRHKESYADKMPFRRRKVRLKREIVTLGVPGVDPTVRVGRYVSPDQWNALISDPEVLLIDTRNRYEVKMGTFARATDPETTSFREFPEYVARESDPSKHKKVAMFRTGGIRAKKRHPTCFHRGLMRCTTWKAAFSSAGKTSRRKSRFGGASVSCLMTGSAWITISSRAPGRCAEHAGCRSQRRIWKRLPTRKALAVRTATEDGLR